MRRNKTESGEGQEKPAIFRGNRRTLLIMGLIVFLASFVRVVFSFGTSAGSEFALSGGSVSTNNLYVLSELVGNGVLAITDSSLYYPYGSVTTSPILFTIVLYPFAMLANVFVSDPVLASSMTLAATGPVFAALSVIMAYLLGKMILRTKLAGYLAAFFVAMCPVLVKESVFSNGTGASFVLFLFMLVVYFLFKAVCSVDYREDANDNKSAYCMSLVAGVFLALLAITWVEYRAVFMPLLVILMVQPIIDRLRGRDPMPMIIVYSLPIVLMAVVATVYYGALGLWSQIASGTVFLTAVVCAIYAAFGLARNKPWTLTIPVFVVVALVLGVVLAVVTPDIFHAMVSGNFVYESAYLATLGQMKLSLSMLSTYYGAITYWFAFIAIVYMVVKIRSNIGSTPHVFLILWMFMTILTCGHNSTQAAIATPVFAIGFALVVASVLKAVDFRAYFSAIRSAKGKLKFRKLLKPAPFISILVTLMLVAAPNVIYVVDASIPSNDVSDFNEVFQDAFDKDIFGAMNYYIKDDETSFVKDALKHIAPSASDGALITWLDYSSDAPLYAGMKSYTDINGNGAVAASNILLANSINGASNAAMLINALVYLGGIDDGIRALLIGDHSSPSTAGLTSEQVDIIDNVLKDADYVIPSEKKTARYIVSTDVDTFGKVRQDISDDNVKYLFLSEYLAKNAHAYSINQAFDNLMSNKNLATPYIMVTSDMMPFYYGYATIFNRMAEMNGYTVENTNMIVDKYTQFGYHAYYYGMYGFTDMMYDTLMYRAYIGMSPEDAGYSSLYDYMQALTLADSSVRMYPGYGLGNYTVEYWEVKYNPNEHAEVDDDGWVVMDAYEAIEKQSINGGLINYMAGRPVVLKYVSNNADGCVTGHVNGISKDGEVRVSAVDKSGILRSTTFVDANGDYKLYVNDPNNSTLLFFAGSKGIKGGVLFDTCPATAVTTPTLPQVKVDLLLMYRVIADLHTIDDENCLVTISNETTKFEKKCTLAEAKDIELAAGTYKVKITKDGSEIYSGDFTTSTESHQEILLYLDSFKYLLELKNAFDQVNRGPDTILIHGEYGISFDVNDLYEGEDDGIFTFYLPKGTYYISAEGYWFDNPSFSVSSDRTSPSTVNYGPAAEVTLVNLPANVSVKFVNAVHRTTEMADSNGVAKAHIPVSYFGKTTYTISYVSGSYVYYAVVNDFDKDIDASKFTKSETMNISGKSTHASDGEVVRSVTVTIYTEDGAMFRTEGNDDGEYTLYNVPKDRDFLMLANNTSTVGYIGKVNAGTTTFDVSLVTSNAGRSSVTWSGVGFDYLDICATKVIDDKTFKFYNTVNVNGTYDFHLPVEVTLDSVEVEIYKDLNLRFKVEDGKSDVKIKSEQFSVSMSVTYTIYATSGYEDKSDKIILDYSAFQQLGDDYPITIIGNEMTFGEAHSDGFTASSSIRAKLGSLDSGEDVENDIYHYENTYRFNPADGFNLSILQLLNVEDISDVIYKRVLIKNVPDDADIEFENVDDMDGNDESEAGQEYFVRLKDGVDDDSRFLMVTIRDEESETPRVLYVVDDLSDMYSTLIIDAADMKEIITVKGFVGTLSEGTYKATFMNEKADVYPFPVTLTTEVEDGKYSIELYKGVTLTKIQVEVQDDDGNPYYLEDPGETFTEDSTRNYGMSGSTNFKVLPMKEENYTVSGGYVYIEKMKIVDANNPIINTDDAGYFTPKFGTAWVSPLIVDSNGMTVTKLHISDQGKYTGDLYLSGYFNARLHDCVSDEMFIQFAGPSSSYYIYLDFDNPLRVSDLVYVNKVADEVSSYEYNYIIEVKNTLGRDIKYKISGLESLYRSGGWIVVLYTDYVEGISAARMVDSDEIPDLNLGVGTTTLKIGLMPANDKTEIGHIPELNVSLQFVGLGADDRVESLSEEGVTIEPSIARVSGEPGASEVDVTDMNAEGRGVFNDLGSIPTIVWVLFAASIILAIFTVWMASRRGVFTRKK